MSDQLAAVDPPETTASAVFTHDDLKPRRIGIISDGVEFATATVLAAVMALAGATKILDPGGAIAFLKNGLGLSAAVSIPVVYSLSALELLLAGAIILGICRWKWPIPATLALIGCFFGLLFEVRRLHPNVGLSCGCFGRLQSWLSGESISGHIMLNSLLALACFLNLVAVFMRNRTTRGLDSSNEIPPPHA
ncbi:MAG: hypothetical protein KF841_12435 [Phycisphaerae bacterium]|nr:hypothetical protein [Phycisphaerae bacterium]